MSHQPRSRSIINAIAHATGNLHAEGGNLVMSLMVEEGIHSLAAGLRAAPLPSRHGDALQLSVTLLAVRYRAGPALRSDRPQAIPHAGRLVEPPHALIYEIILPEALAYIA